MENENKIKRIIAKRALMVLPVLVIVISAAFFCGCAVSKGKLINEELTAIAASGTPGVFVADYDISDFNESFFTDRRGITTYVEKKYIPEKTKDLNSFLTKINENSQGSITHYFIGVDPVKLYANQKAAEEFYSLLGTLGEGADIDILYPVYQADYWNKLTDAKFMQHQEEYTAVSERILSTGKANVYFPGSDLWLLGNPGCFTGEESSVLCDDASKMIIMSCFCDGNYAITSGLDVEYAYNDLSSNLQILNDNLPLIKKGDAKKEILFLGDSIFGIYGPPSSIPEVVRSLYGADVANCGIGGLSLHKGASSAGLSGLLDVLLGEDDNISNDKITERIITENAGSFAYGATLFEKEDDSILTVLVEFGINDYFYGVKAEDFEKDLREEIERIDAQSRNTDIILVVPGFLNMPDMENGEVPFVEGGESFETYREIIRKVAEDKDLKCFDMTKSKYISQENCYYFLEADGVHYGTRGRFITGMELCEFFEGEY